MTRRCARQGGPKFQHLLPRERQQLRPHDWPAADRTRWERAQNRDNPFDFDGVLADSAPRSIRTYAEAYGVFLGWLDSVNELDAETPLEHRLTIERLGRFILSLRERCRASTIDGRLVCLKSAMRALAPASNWDWITRHPLAPTAREIRASRKPIKQIDSVAILKGAIALMDSAAQPHDPTQAALDYRNGLLIAFQSVFTLRLGNLTEIVIGEHLVGRGNRRFLQFQETVKNKADLDYEVPAWLVGHVDIYLANHRPLLLGDRVDHRHLWVCHDGQPLQPCGVNVVFEHRCRALDGSRLTTHPFRHAKATAFMLRDAGNLDLAAASLGHVGVSSVCSVYDRSGGIAASRAWNKVLRTRVGRISDESDSDMDA
jgi:integrase